MPMNTVSIPHDQLPRTDGGPEPDPDRCYKIIIVNSRVMLRYLEEYDLTPVLTCIARAGELAHAWHLGNQNGALWWQGKAIRLQFGPARP